MNRDELIEGAARALYAAQDRADPFESLADLYAEGYYNDARIILDFVEPIIRADELASRSPPPAVEGGWRDIASRITDYLSAGGLFNPELMDHQKVRDLLIDARDALAGKKA